MFQSMRDKTLKKSKAKTVVLPLAIAASMSFPLGAYAQSGLFQRGVSDEVYYGHGSNNYESQNYGLLGNSNRDVATSGNVTNHPFGYVVNPTGITNHPFGNTTPLGSGILILIGAGTGYAVAKSKKKHSSKSNGNQH